MLRLLALHGAPLGDASAQALDTLGSAAAKAGFSLQVSQQAAGQGPVDAVCLLLDSATPPTALGSLLNEARGLCRNTALVLIRVQGTLAQLPSTSGVLAQWQQACQGFLYPYALDIASDQAAEQAIKAWLPGFAKFAAATKLWRSLDGLGLDDAARARQRPEMNHVNILTRDLEASKAFYADILGANYCYNLGPRKAVMELNGFDFFIEQSEAFSYPVGYHIGIRALPEDVRRIAEQVTATGTIKLVKGNGPAPGYHHGPDQVRSAVYFEDPDGLVIEVYSAEVEMIESNPRLLLDRL
jgi:catechol 2,3-dioxygenase-like lactoylglutathione lyase family enzyme